MDTHELLVQGIREIYAQIDERTAAFAAVTGIACKPSCGQCCQSRQVEATIAEMLPLAEALVRDGTDEAVRGAASAAADAGDPRCIMFRPDLAGNGRGLCGAYEHRPSLCRMFGYAAIKKRDGSSELATCRVMRLEDPASVAVAEAAARSGGAPEMADFGMAVTALAGGNAAMTTRLPINDAIVAALDRVGLRHQMLSWAIQSEKIGDDEPRRA